jgi:hypothetical protein
MLRRGGEKSRRKAGKLLTFQQLHSFYIISKWLKTVEMKIRPYTAPRPASWAIPSWVGMLDSVAIEAP